MAELTLTTPQYAALSAVELDAGISNDASARMAFVTLQSMHGVLSDLVRDGLMLREPDPTHGRILRSILTPAGQSILAAAHLKVASVENIMIASIGSETANQISKVLFQCSESLETPSE